MNNSLIKITNLSKIYKVNDANLTIINNISLDLNKNCITSVVGPSGSGKSTLLNYWIKIF